MIFSRAMMEGRDANANLAHLVNAAETIESDVNLVDLEEDEFVPAVHVEDPVDDFTEDDSTTDEVEILATPHMKKGRLIKGTVKCNVKDNLI